MRNRKGQSFSGLIRALGMVFALAVWIAAYLPAAWGQSESINGTIRGRVSDPADQPVAAANVTAFNNATAYTRSVATGEDGYYVIPTLPLGTYTVTVSKEGFSTLKFSEIVLQAGREAVVDAALKIGAITTSVEVSGGAPIIDPTRTSIGGIISEKEVQNLPLTSRNPYNWIMFQPG
ncbi:MAG: carboxypeptidase-like regulatory domain-containing protein, partial [Candidatus Acidiferrales bacterium]